ncbi:Succinyl-CoA ligase [ADP-forming] beta chain [hydrothermal vent metagenome]|uniref:Succinyl-CoA ligase [ADP-forming] beta chain n=1 Tax=hydrothermal vent metagenome TaxID=652676 RepID=A0A1W1CU18_9ZZZZ
MNIHEYQAKKIFTDYNIKTPKSLLIDNINQVENACKQLGSNIFVVKAQIHAGARGKAGGVIICNNIDEAKIATKKLLKTNLITHQTDAKGLPVNLVLIEEGLEIKNEYYLSFLIDRQCQKIVILASTQGGMDIEKVAEETPKKIIKTIINPITGLLDYQCRSLAFDLDLNNIKEFSSILKNLYQLFIEKDASLIEINPLVRTTNNELFPLDAKLEFDNSALYRQSDIEKLRDTSQENDKENQANDYQLNYIALEGNIGCMVNGAGLAMATMDLIQSLGGSPANFLDVGGSTTPERVKKAFEIITSDKNVKVILVNIFGGIVRCDLIAQGILNAIEESNLSIPLIVRLEGTNAQQGLALLKTSSYNIITEQDLTKATKKAISLL